MLLATTTYDLIGRRPGRPAQFTIAANLANHI
jgi:hypothetical protein